MSTSLVRLCRRLVAIAAVLVVAVAAIGTAAPAAATPAAPPYERPIDAGDGVVVDPFRAPPGPYAAGNRGLDYVTVPLSIVHASAAGVVVFAGSVGGTLHVTILHDDGLRTSYSFLAALDVRTGEHVGAGAPIGRTGASFHFGVRDPDGTYLDPELLFAPSSPPHVRLVPGGDDGATPTPDASGERHAFDEVVRQHRGSPAIELARLWMHNASELRVATHVERIVTGMASWYLARDDCTPVADAATRPPGRRILVEVGGIGSTSEAAAVARVDTATLGYASADVVRFSYRGGRVPSSGEHGVAADLDHLPITTYDADDSQGDLVEAGARLADLLERIAAAAPGVPIDLVAHSQGGVVARVALDDADQRGRLPAAVQTLVTLGTPHQGADLAAVVRSTQLDPAGAARLDQLRRALDVPLDPNRPAVAQLAASSPVIARLQGRPVPPGVRFTSVGARGDLVVTANRTVVEGPGTHHTVVPLVGVHAHDELPGSTAATREIALAVGGRPPTCRGAGAVGLDLAVPEEVSLVESSAALPATAATTGLRWPVPGGSP